MREGTPLMCTCNDYEENIPKINAGFVMSHIHGMSGYQDKEISFCPWRQKINRKKGERIMLYGASVTKYKGKTRNHPWLLVDPDSFKQGGEDDSLVCMKSDEKRMRRAIRAVFNEGRKDGFIRVWNDGQGVRSLDYAGIEDVSIVSLDISSPFIKVSIDRLKEDVSKT